MKTDSLSLIVNPKKKTLKKGIMTKAKKKALVKNTNIRKATLEDTEAVFTVASSVGASKKEAYNGFLMDNYASSPRKFKKFFADKIKELEYFYIAESNGQPLGFLMGYTKEEWLKYNPEWIDDISWSPAFDMQKTENFVLTDKIATHAEFTGNGIGSKIYKQYMKDLAEDGIYNIFSETLVSPTPNFASLSFRKKQKFTLAGTRFEKYKGKIYTDLIYYKPVVR